MEKVEFVFKDYQKVLSELKSEIESRGSYVYFEEFCRDTILTNPFYVAFPEFNMSFKETFLEEDEYEDEEGEIEEDEEYEAPEGDYKTYLLFFDVDPFKDEFGDFGDFDSLESLVEFIAEDKKTTKEAVLNSKAILIFE